MKEKKTMCLLFLLAIVLITLFSCCSWIYPLQPHDDANVFMSIGKSMLSGKLLYTEVHDHKGPVLYFLHEWAAVLSSRTFFGIYLLEVLCCFGFLVYSYRMMCMFAEHSICMVTICLVGVLTYSSDFMFYGDMVEELSLPVLSCILYKTLRYAKHGQLPNRWEALFIGAGVAAVFWMKYTVLFMCFGSLAAILILAVKRNHLCGVMSCLGWMTVGAAALTTPVMTYFIVHGNIQSMYQSYFIFNICSYANRAAEVLWLPPLKVAGWLVLISVVLMARISRDVKVTIALCWGAELLTFVLIKVYLYYFLTIYIFAPFIIYIIRKIKSRILIHVIAIILIVIATMTNFNLMTLINGKFPTAVLPMAKIINADNDPDKQVLTINSYDTGIYTLTDCLPPIKYFVTPNVYVKELVDEQTDYLTTCKAKYLIRKTDGFEHYYETFHPDLSRDYRAIYTTTSAYRPELLLHPLEYLWTLGYIRGVVEKQGEPERRVVTYRLYRIKSEKATGVIRH